MPPSAMRAARRTLDRGVLYVVATPIWNMRDISVRASEVLLKVPIIAAASMHSVEGLLRTLSRASAGFPVGSQSGAETKVQIITYHNFNEAERVPMLLRQLTAGRDVALVSRVGTPGLHDPGRALVAAAHAQGFKVHALPGPSSVAAALSVSGLSGDRFYMDGNLPALRAARIDRFKQLSAAGLSDANAATTVGFFCDGNHVVEVLKDAVDIFGKHVRGCVAKDISMATEIVHTDTIETLHRHWVEQPEHYKQGAIVFLVEMPAQIHRTETAVQLESPERSIERVASVLMCGAVPPQKAALLASQLTGSSLSFAKQAVERFVLSGAAQKSMDGAKPSLAHSDDSVKLMLKLTGLGFETTAEELAAILASLGAPKADLRIATNQHGEKVAFANFASPAAASAARSCINVADVCVDAGGTLAAHWARREP